MKTDKKEYDAAVLHRKVNDVYYWIPRTADAKVALGQLMLATTVMREKVARAEVAYKVKLDEGSLLNRAGNQVELAVAVSPPLPNDNGTLKAQIGLHIVPSQVLSQGDAAKVPTVNAVRLQYNMSANGIPVAPEGVLTQLKDQEAAVLLANSFPTPPKTEKLLEDIYNVLIETRMQQSLP